MNAYTRNRQNNRPSFPEDREKFGTEFLDNIGDRINETAFGRFRQEGLQKQADLQQKVYESSSPLIQKVIDVGNTPNKIEQQILTGISDATQIDERISTPLTYAAIAGGVKGVSKIKPKNLGITQTIEPFTPPKSVGKVPRKIVNITDQVDDVFNMPSVKVQDIIRVAKKNKISYKKAEAYLNLKTKAIVPTETINPGTNAGLIQAGEGVDDPTVYIPPEERIGTQKGDPLAIINTGDTGMGGLSPRRKDENYSQWFDRQMSTHGAKRNEFGEWIMDEDTFRNIASSNVRREIAQLLLTDINQGVKGSFISEKRKKNSKLNKDLQRYNAKFNARADLHHGSPSVIGIEFFLGIPYMGQIWKEQIKVAAEYGNFPGQPMVEGKDNLVALPSGAPSTAKGVPIKSFVDAKEALEKLGRKVPKHIHRIIHDQFLANEIGQKGEKFWAKWNPLIFKNPEQNWPAAYRDFNRIIARNRQLYTEALEQLDVIFGQNPLSGNPGKLADMLEEYVSKGKILIGKGVVRGKDGKPIIVKPGTDIALSGQKTAEYTQEAVHYEIEDTLLDFKKAIRQERLTDPRYRDVVEEIELYPQLTDAEKLEMEELLYFIRNYNSIFAKYGGQRAYYVTRITKEQHKINLRRFDDLSQYKIFNFPSDAIIPTTATFRRLKTTTHRDVKLSPVEQMKLIFELP